MSVDWLETPNNEQEMNKIKLLAIISLLVPFVGTAAEVNTVFEASFESSKDYENPFMELEVDVLFSKGEQEWKIPAFWDGITVKGIEPGSWSAFYFDPVAGRRYDLGVQTLSGDWKSPNVPSPQDWVLVMGKVIGVQKGGLKMPKPKKSTHSQAAPEQ